MPQETKDNSVTELEQEISTCEQRLQELRNDYMARTGHMPTRLLNDSSWKWSIFMCLGFAFISMVVYLLGIQKVGQDAGIPEFFFQTEIAYFFILTFYVILMVLMVQSKKLSGYQSMSLILGFWCAHWLIYDWGWYAYSYAVGEIPDLSAFWQSTFSSPLLIPNPPYWLFLTIAILGGLMAFYTFTVPKRRRHLIPPMIWLYATYINASICGMTGLNPTGILIVGLILVSITFGLMGYYSIQRMAQGLPNWLKDGTSKRKWMTSDPLGLPLIFAMVTMLIIMPLFLTTNPTLGLFLGMIPWFFLPTYYILIHSTGVAKMRGTPKILIIVSLTALFIAFVVILSILPIDSLI